MLAGTQMAERPIARRSRAPVARIGPPSRMLLHHLARAVPADDADVFGSRSVAAKALRRAEAAVVGDTEDDVDVRIGLQDRLRRREGLRRQHRLGAVDDLRVRRQLGDLLFRAADALSSCLVEIGGETGDLRFAAQSSR